MSKITTADKIGILVFGLIFAIGGIYGLWLELEGRYLDMGLLYFIWFPLDIPDTVIATGVEASGSTLYIIAFIYWFLLGSFIASIPMFLKKLFSETSVN